MIAWLLKRISKGKSSEEEKGGWDMKGERAGRVSKVGQGSNKPKSWKQKRVEEKTGKIKLSKGQTIKLTRSTSSVGIDKRHKFQHQSVCWVNHCMTQTPIHHPPPLLHNRQLDCMDKMENKCVQDLWPTRPVFWLYENSHIWGFCYLQSLCAHSRCNHWDPVAAD